MDEEAVRVGVAGVGLLGRVMFCVVVSFMTLATMLVVVSWRLALSVVEDDDFVDAEDGEGACDLAG